MGLQVPYYFRAQARAQSDIRADALSSGTDFHALAKQKECQIIMGHVMPDHVHMCIAIPPKQPVASVMDS